MRNPFDENDPNTPALLDPSASLGRGQAGRSGLIPAYRNALPPLGQGPQLAALLAGTTISYFGWDGALWKALSLSSRLQDSDNDTWIDVENAPDEDQIRMTIAGTLRMLIQATTPEVGITGGLAVSGNLAIGPTVSAGVRLLLETWPGLGVGTHTMIGITLSGEQLANATTKQGFAFFAGTGYDTAGFNLTNFYGLSVQPTLANSVGTGVLANLVAIRAGLSMGAGGLPVAITDAAAFDALTPLDSGGSVVTTGRGHRIRNQGGSFITTSYAIDIAAQSGAATVRTIRALGVAPSIHEPAIAFGQNVAAGAFVDIVGSTAAMPSARIRAGTAPTAPLEGDTWNDSTQKDVEVFTAGVRQRDTRTLFTQTSSVFVFNTASETSLMGAIGGTAALPANFFTIGKTIRFRAWGYWSTDGTAGQTLTIRIRLGGAAGTVVLATGAIACATTVSTRPWRIEGDITCRTIGNPGTVLGQGGFWTPDAAGTIQNDLWANMVQTAAANLNTTAAQDFFFSADWNSADTLDTITCTNATLEVLN